jgi:chromosome segregation ATPase
MDVSKVFTEVFNKIEESNLNYVIHHKTPFSAQISLKRSFVKFSDAPDPVTKQVEFVVKKQSNETCEYKNVTKVLEAATRQIDHLETALKHERKNVKSLQEEISEHREEALKLKREQKESKVKIDEQESTVKKLENENLNLLEEKARIQAILTDKIDRYPEH